MKAPETPHVEPFGEERAKAERLAGELGLTPEQRDGVAQLLADYRAQLRALWNEMAAKARCAR